MLSQHPPTTAEQEVAAHYRQFRNEFVAWAGKNFSADAEDAKDVFQEALLVFSKQRQGGQLDASVGVSRPASESLGHSIRWEEDTLYI